jgi:hypothetical protein
MQHSLALEVDINNTVKNIACFIWNQKVYWRIHATAHFILFHEATAPSGPGFPYYWGFTITLRHITLGRTLLDEWSARHRDLYLTKQNTQKRHTSMSPAGFEPTIPASERPQTHALDRAATGIGISLSLVKFSSRVNMTKPYCLIYLLMLSFNVFSQFPKFLHFKLFEIDFVIIPLPSTLPDPAHLNPFHPNTHYLTPWRCW